MHLCDSYARTRQLKHARELVSSILGSSRRGSYHGGLTEQETRYTTVGQDTTTVLRVTNGSLLEDDDDELLTYFSNPIEAAEVDADYWIASNDSVPILPSFYPLLKSTVSVPNGSARVISERIKEVLRNRSIAAVYDSNGAKADCTTKNNVNFRIRLYRGRGDETSSIIVEIQRKEGFDVKFQQDMAAIFDASEGKAADPTLDEEFIPAIFDPTDDINNYDQSTINRISSILCPQDELATTARGTEFAFSALVSATNAKESGHKATMISKDLLLSRQFSSLRDVIISYACSLDRDPFSPNQSNRTKLQALEILANATSCLQMCPDSDAFTLTSALRLHLITLVENAASDPRAADLACLIFKHTAEAHDWTNHGEKARLDNALAEANRLGRESYVDLEVHSHECMSLTSGIMA